MEEDEEEQGGGEVGGHWELWFGTADWELWERRERKKQTSSALQPLRWELARLLVSEAHRTDLRWDLGTGGTGPVAVHPHAVLGQELLQVHVLELEQAPVAGQGPLPQHGPQEGRLGVGAQRAGAQAPPNAGGAPGVDAHRVLVGVQGLVFVWSGGGGQTRSQSHNLRQVSPNKRKRSDEGCAWRMLQPQLGGCASVTLSCPSLPPQLFAAFINKLL